MRRGMPAIVLVIFAAGTAPAEQPKLTARQRGDLAIQARAILRKYCSECHKSATSFDILDCKQLTAKDRPVPFVGLDTPRSQIVELIEDGSMPPGARAKRPAAEEIKVLKDWIGAKAPNYPNVFDDSYALSTVLADWSSQKDGDKGRVRYVSLAHLIRDDSGLLPLQAQQDRLQLAINAATIQERAALLVPVDDAATIFRIDIDKLGWAAKDLFDVIGPKGDVVTVHEKMIPFDLLLLENPYPLADARFDGLLGTAKHVRPAPFIRGDWLADVLAPGSPLAADLQSLVELTKAIDNPPCGPKVRVFEKAKTAAGGNPPITAWYSADRLNSFEVSFKLTPQSADSVRVGESFRFDVKSERAARFVLLNVLSNGELRVVPVQGTVLKKDEVFKLGPTPTTFFKITSILSGTPVAAERFILIVADGDIPLPTIVRSRHNVFDCPKDRGPVYRYLFATDAEKWDGDKAARKVVTIAVAAK
jgi:hypothetical protein